MEKPLHQTLSDWLDFLKRHGYVLGYTTWAFNGEYSEEVLSEVHLSKHDVDRLIAEFLGE